MNAVLTISPSLVPRILAIFGKISHYRVLRTTLLLFLLCAMFPQPQPYQVLNEGGTLLPASQPLNPSEKLTVNRHANAMLHSNLQY